MTTFVEKTRSRPIILLAFDLNPNYGSEAGRACLWLRLAARHHPMVVITDSVHQASIEQDVFPNVEFHFVESSTALRTMKGAKGRQWAFAAGYRFFVRNAYRLVDKLIKEKDFGAIHCITPAGIGYYNNFYRFGLPVLVGPVGGGLPTPTGFPSVFGNERLKNRLRGVYFKCISYFFAWRKYFIRSSLILVSSGYERSLLPQSARLKTMTAFNAVVDTKSFTPASEMGLNSVPVIFFAGSLVRLKAINLLLEAASRLPSINFVLEIAGSGPEEASLKALAIHYGLEAKVRFLGDISKSEMILKYQQSDIFCLPSLRETAGNAVIEAMACGLPVIVANYVGPADAVNDDCGIRVPIDNSAVFVDSLVKALLDLLMDATLRKKLGMAGRERAIAEFSADALERKIMEAYRQVLQGSDIESTSYKNTGPLQ